jgi:thiamine-monophosphate kinase
MTRNKTLGDLGEAGIIRLMEANAPKELPSHLKKGIGDDCAVLKTAGDSVLLVTTDTLVEGIHFTAHTMPPEALGWKALAANISDIAAMGGAPHTAFLSIGLKSGTKVSFLESFMAGFKTLADKTGIVLAGGDTVESPSSAVVTITLLGDCLKERVVYRSGARVGDDVWVTGPLGNAAAGLFLLQNQGLDVSPEYESLVQAHQKPMPPLKLAKALAQSGLVHAMIDISDGIAKDLGHICEQSGVGSELQGTSIPMSSNLLKLAAETEKNPVEWALHGGEDYEILFAASPDGRNQILSLAARVTSISPVRIGAIVENDGIRLETEDGKVPVKSGGYVHF